MALDTIATTQTMRDNETIVSAGGTFELGFFSPGTSKYRYLGVWYKKISYKTIVWVANRDTLLTDSCGVLKFNDRGIPVLLNQSNAVIWSSGTSRGVRNPVAQLLDSGNLVVRDEDDLIPENFLWQSFDNPVSTFLPGMKIGLVNESLYVCFSSWKSIDDPSDGNFTVEVDLSGLQMYLKQNSVAKARSGPWNGVGFSGMPYLKPNPIYNYTFVFYQKEVYYTYELVDSSFFTRIVLNQDGLIEPSLWVDRTSSWSRYLSAPDNCDTYALCGVHGSCAINNSPVCRCLKGFVPKQQKLGQSRLVKWMCPENTIGMPERRWIREVSQC
ncbi:hypothetical protein GH714_008802 [Hevea brasiliensis]|uniref:Bulb-type lectin domain-containing protein n=1 Tax=Hevea brasiliensis TaxID=3981 RepID=A0A6A6KAI3_HEVBR|nr:hypothetical protein GH714_008802 [Hevea brasiliensis]